MENKDKNERRNFLNRLAVSGAALASAPLLGSFSTNNTEENKQKMEAIQSIKAMGFQWQTQDPFLFCVHHEDNYPEGNDKMGPSASLSGRQLGSDFHIKDGWRMYHGKSVPGFPGHPHRGFETLTVVRKGSVDHSDSAGGAGRYGDGDLQWMTAGKGLMHAEMFPLIHKEKKNPLELFQIWLNLPRSKKMAPPDYKMFWNEEIPKFNAFKGVKVEVLVGSLFGKSAPIPPPNSWAHDPNNFVGVYNFHLEPKASFVLPKTEKGINRSLYVYNASTLQIENKLIADYHCVEVESNRDLSIVNGETPAKFLVLQGRPINEPVVQHGPFVMNSRQEIQEAFQDYQRDQFGGWPWPSYDHVHPRTLGRFAKYPDGREEKKS